MTEGPYGPYGQDPQGPEPSGQYPYGQQPYGQYPYGPPPWPQQLPAHPSATTAMVLGIVAVAAGLALTCSCGVGIVLFALGPFAWYLGGKAVHEIDAHPGTYGGRGEATTGRILGIVATVLLFLGILAFAGFVALMFASPDFRSGFEGEYDRLLRG